jgi:hypothetical protein
MPSRGKTPVVNQHQWSISTSGQTAPVVKQRQHGHLLESTGRLSRSRFTSALRARAGARARVTERVRVRWRE